MKNKTKIKVAICQFKTEKEEESNNDHEQQITKNLIKAKRFIQEASQKEADLIIFPEYFITGIIENKLHLASKESKWVNEFQKLAVEFSIDIVPGTIVEEESNLPPANLDQPPTFFNSAYYIDKSGKIINKYRKKNLWHSEKYLTPCTNENQVFEALDGIRIGLLICWDLAWPEAFRDLMKQKVDLIIIPSFWTIDEPTSKMNKHDPKGINESNLIDSLVISRALETESCVIFVNCAGDSQDGFLGRSSAAMPLIGPLVKLDSPDEKLALADIDFNILKDAKEVYKINEEFNFKSFS